MFAKGQIAQEKEQPKWGRFLNKKIVKRYVACDDDMDHCYEIDIRYVFNHSSGRVKFSEPV